MPQVQPTAAAPPAGALFAIAPAPTYKPGPADINPDYIGWLEIAGTDGGRLPDTSYPVVQGEDNDKYLTTTFEGTESKLGAIFADYRCAGAFDAPHTILYGHNARDGSMFGSLARYLDAEYLAQHPDITISLPEGGPLPDGESLTYRIFAVRETDVNDPAYRLDFADDAELAAFAADLGAPEGTTTILTLSTCTSGGSRDNRLLVHAALVKE